MATMPYPNLSRAEWRAVSIALKDAAQCGCADTAERGGLGGRLLRLVRAVTGASAARPLADQRLEAIRRFVCATRRARRPAERYVPDLVAQGFNPAQVEALALLSA